MIVRMPGDGPFAKLAALRGLVPEGKPSASEAKPAIPAPKLGPARAVVRMERKGRGGKEVTVIDQLGLGATELEAWCKKLKSALGCGGAVDGTLIILQGDLRTRAPALLETYGVRRVTVG